MSVWLCSTLKIHSAGGRRNGENGRILGLLHNEAFKFVLLQCRPTHVLILLISRMKKGFLECSICISYVTILITLKLYFYLRLFFQ